MARDPAQARPHQVRQLATLGSPFRLPAATPLESLFRNPAALAARARCLAEPL